MESCALLERIYLAWDRYFWVGRSPGKSNPSLTLDRKTAEIQSTRKLHCRISQVRFERWRLEISRNQAHQSTRLSQAHLLVRSVSHFPEFQFFVISWQDGPKHQAWGQTRRHRELQSMEIHNGPHSQGEWCWKIYQGWSCITWRGWS